MASFSRSRNPASPSFSKMKAMSTPVLASISASLSWNENPAQARQMAADGGLARAHGSDEEDVALGEHASASIQKERGRPKAAARFDLGGISSRADHVVTLTGMVATVTDLDSGEVTVMVMEPELGVLPAAIVNGSVTPPANGSEAGPSAGPPPVEQPTVHETPVPLSVPIPNWPSR